MTPPATTRTIPGTEIQVSLCGLGCNNFGMLIDEEQTRAVVHAALDAGVTFFDTARMYGGGRSEQFLGRALGARRDEAVIATKFGAEGKGAGPDYVREAVDVSLDALGTDRIDLYQLHYPDPDVPIAETLGALAELVEAGKIRAFGHSNLTATQTREADAAATTAPAATSEDAESTDAASARRFVTAQVEWNMVNRAVKDDVIPTCRELGLGVLPYFPLAAGVLTGKYRRGQEFPEGSRLERMAHFAAQASDENLATVERLSEWADGHGMTMVGLALSWLASHDVTLSVIAGATRPDQVAANAASTTVLTPTQLTEIDALLRSPLP